jgi:thiosulfate reductase/polysulfide reductase chain A
VDDGAYVELRNAVLSGQPYPIRGWMIYKQNPMHILPDRRRTEAMFRKMEFVAVVDIVPSDSAWLADVILPESTYLERLDPAEEFNAPYPFVGLRQQVVPPVFNTKPNLEIMQGLASRLGLSTYFDFDIHRYIDAQLVPAGITVRDLKATGTWTNRTGRKYGATRNPDHRFRTPSGKIELVNERLRRNGYDPRPRARCASCRASRRTSRTPRTRTTPGSTSCVPRTSCGSTAKAPPRAASTTATSSSRGAQSVKCV